MLQVGGVFGRFVVVVDVVAIGMRVHVMEMVVMIRDDNK